jgi:DsbC/DsbD-like thiol-disulfide interchange protein/cytochrome c biogenesis protein CcdA
MHIAPAYRLLVAALWHCIAVLALAAPAQAEPTRISAELRVASAAVPGGETTLAIHMKPEPGWHGYWLNPGDAGLGMQLDWSLPDGAKVGEPRYPVPQTLTISGLMNHVYKGDYAVLVPLTLPADARPGSVLPVSLRAQWLACTDEICVPERGVMETTVPVAHGRAESGPPRLLDGRFDHWLSQLPAPLDAEARFTIEGDSVRIAIPLPASMSITSPHVFAAEDRVVDYAAPQRFSRAGDLLVVELERAAFEPRDPDRLTGVLRLNDAGDGLSFSAVPGAVPGGGEPLTMAASRGAANLPLLLIGALLGGLLLNIMPCVFPILSLKALSLARAGESETQARTEGVAYTAGVIAACIALGALLLALRAAGEEVGWAFQLQEPGVVVALLLLAVAITANFLGLFEFAAPGFAEDGSARGAFATGLLAALVATPCTGPFMAAAMGAALLLPVLPALALFAALGLGIALPFLAIAFLPALRARLPRPGLWMMRFRRWMALPMGLTALALAWLASRVGGTGFAVAACMLVVALVAVLAMIGKRQRRGKGVAALSLTGIAAIAAAAFAVLPQTVAAPSSSTPGIIAARPFNEVALAEARATGKPVFAWFTADWCLTCKVNEQAAIEREATREAFEQAGVIVLRGDWTRRDPAITRYLTSRGAAGVPLYVWYPADGGAPIQLPQLLTQHMLVDLAGTAAGD